MNKIKNSFDMHTELISTEIKDSLFLITIKEN